MGLLDDLYIGHNANFGGQGGGLLDFLRNSQMQQDQYQPSAGFPQPSPLDNAQWPYGPNNGPSALDNAQWPSGPVGAPANFADRFNAMPGAPQPFQGSGRSFDTATFDPSTYAPNQAQPIAVGNNYQMPRIGTADQFTPPMNAQAALPPNAQPTQGQLPQMGQQPSQQSLPPAFGQQSDSAGGNALTGLQSFLNGGGLISSIRGAMNGQRSDPAGMAQQNLSAQHQSLTKTLMANGDSQQVASSKAMLALMNPEAAKTILPELFTNKEKYGVISEDPLEGKKYGFINERDQTVNGRPINQQPASTGGGLAGIQAAQNAGVTGDALYEHLPPAMRNTVKAMIEGRQPLPSTTAMRSPATLALIDAAHAIDPAFDATSWGSRVKGQADYYGGGKSSEIMRKANQSALHFGELVSDKMADLPGHAIPAANAAANFVNTNVLGKGAQGNFEVNAHALADELAGLFKGANLSDTEIRAWESRLSPNMSLEQQRGMAKTLLGLYRDSVTALEKKRVESIGQAAAEKKGPILGPEADAALAGVEKFANGGERAAKGASSIPEGATATNPQTGAKITFRNGKWQ